MKRIATTVLVVFAALAASVLLSCGGIAEDTPPVTRLSVDASTLGLWHFNEGSGQVVADSSGSAWDLSLGADATAEPVDPAWTAAGKFGSGLSFTAADEQYVSGPGQTGFVASQELTVEFWIKTTSTSTSTPMTTGNICFYIQLNDTGILQAEVGDGIDWSGSTSTGTAINDGQWHYIAIVYDGALNGGTLSVYLDGTLENDGGGLGTVLVEPGAWYIGGRPFNAFLDGAMDEVRVSTSARSEAEIAANY